jgi:hypothetical protein
VACDAGGGSPGRISIAACLLEGLRQQLLVDREGGHEAYLLAQGLVSMGEVGL